MRPEPKWPLHPAPLDGEALSSWLGRLAACYQMSPVDLLHHGLGLDFHPDDVMQSRFLPHVDVDPQEALILGLAGRTGVAPERIRTMTHAGWAPWMFDSVHPTTGAFDAYVARFSVVLRPRGKTKTVPGKWRPWLSEEPVLRGCPACLDATKIVGLQLVWELPVMLTCPLHNCLLQPLVTFIESPLWEKGPEKPAVEPAPCVLEMDRRTHQAMTTGRVDLPGHRIHAGIWFRLLRTLIHELSIPSTSWGSSGKDLRAAWRSSGHRIRAGQGAWRPFEALSWPVQAKLLEASAATIEMLGTGAITGRGTKAALFTLTPAPVARREPKLRRAGRPEPEATYEELWAQIWKAFEDALRIARADPNEAQVLYNFMLHGCPTPEAAEQTVANLAELGIATDKLSLKPRIGPYA